MNTFVQSITASIDNVNAASVCIKPAKFKALVRLLRDLVKLHGPRPIRIENSRISQWVGSANYYLDVDMSNLLDVDGEQGSRVPISLQFVLLPEDIKALTGLVGGSVELREHANSYAFASEHFEVHLQKAPGLGQGAILTFPHGVEDVGEAVASVNWAALKQYVGNKRTVTLYTYSEQLEMIGVAGKSPFLLNPSSRLALAGQAPNAVLVSQHFLTLAGELELTLGLLRTGENFWLKTSSRPCLVNNLASYECLYSGCV